MKAIHKYKEAAKRGNKEAQRRIAQSMGYRISIWDMPHMVALLHKAGIFMNETENVLDYKDAPDTKTLQV